VKNKAAALEPALPPDRAAQLVWFDPGTTTGVCVVSMDAEWLAGAGSGTPQGFRRAMFYREHYQLGRYPKDHDDLGVPGEAALDALTARRASSSTWEELRSVVGGLSILRSLPWAAWGYEDFRVRQINTTEEFLSPARIGSSLRDFMLTEERPRLGFKQGSDMMSTASNDKLMAAGMYRRGMPHATDAARHAYVFLRRARQSFELRADAWPHLFGGEK
jgi:hypothetical protein